MEKQLIELNILVPPAPVLEQAVGYQNYRKARYFALWWEPCGDEAMVSDGFVTFTGLWSGYLAYVQHHHVHPRLTAFNLGSSEESAEYRLIFDLEERRAYIATCREAENLLTSQWGNLQEKPVTISQTEMEKLLADLTEQLSHFPSMDELLSQMAEDQQNVKTLLQWLDEQTQ